MLRIDFAGFLESDWQSKEAARRAFEQMARSGRIDFDAFWRDFLSDLRFRQLPGAQVPDRFVR